MGIWGIRSERENTGGFHERSRRFVKSATFPRATHISLCSRHHGLLPDTCWRRVPSTNLSWLSRTTARHPSASQSEQCVEQYVEEPQVVAFNTNQL